MAETTLPIPPIYSQPIDPKTGYFVPAWQMWFSVLAERIIASASDFGPGGANGIYITDELGIAEISNVIPSQVQSNITQISTSLPTKVNPISNDLVVIEDSVSGNTLSTTTISNLINSNISEVLLNTQNVTGVSNITFDQTVGFDSSKYNHYIVRIHSLIPSIAGNLRMTPGINGNYNIAGGLRWVTMATSGTTPLYGSAAADTAVSITAPATYTIQTQATTGASDVFAGTIELNNLNVVWPSSPLSNGSSWLKFRATTQYYNTSTTFPVLCTSAGWLGGGNITGIQLTMSGGGTITGMFSLYGIKY